MRAGERIGVVPLLVLAGLTYLAGLATFLAVSANVLEMVWSVLLAGNIDVLSGLLQADGFADPLSFVTRAIERRSRGLLYPVGAVAFPAILFVQAWQAGRASWWLWAAFALGPLVGIGLGTISFPVTVGLDLLLYVALPAVAIVGCVASYGRN